MENLPRSCRQSEKRLLPRPLCEDCQKPIRPSWREATGTYEDSIDPLGVVSYRCATPLCPSNRPF